MLQFPSVSHNYINKNSKEIGFLGNLREQRLNEILYSLMLLPKLRVY